MASLAPPIADEPPAAPPRRPGGGGLARIISLALIVVIALAVLVAGGVRWLDTESGRAFIVRQLPLIAPKSGLTIRAGRIEGSIFGAAVIHDLEIGDPKGAFVVVPRLELDWRPLAIIENEILVRRAHAPEVRLLRLPKFNPTDSTQILPDQDILIGSLSIDRLVLEPPVAGKRHVIAVAGKADVRSGRALIDLDAHTLDAGGGDSVVLKLDSEPDRDRFDIDARVTAPAGGAIAGLAGLDRPLTATITGDGHWQQWRGKLVASYGGAPLADIAVTAADGHFSARGTARPAMLLKGAAARLSAPVISIDASSVIANRQGDIRLNLADPALTATLAARIDFASETIRSGTLEARLLQPQALHRRISGQDVRLTAQLAGKLAAPLIDYRLTAARAAWGETAVTNLRAAGIIRAGDRTLVVPVTATASAVTGVGATAGELLTNVRVEGPLTLAGGKLVSNSLSFRSDRLSGRATAVVTFDTGDFLLTVNGQLPRYAIPGLGLVDLTADMRAVPDAKGARISGKATGRVVRLDSESVAGFLGGLPTVTADVDVGGDLSVAFRNARLVAPALTLTANGTLSPDLVVKASGSGESRAYGPVTLAVAGPATRPVIDLGLAKPGFGVGLARVAARIEPGADGWHVRATGDSDMGPAAAQVTIRNAAEPMVIDVANISVGGFAGHGQLTQTAAGPFAGKLAVVGNGLSGSATLTAEGAVQRADLLMTANEATVPLAMPISIAAGRIAATVRLPDGKPSVTGDFNLTSLERDGLRLDKAQGKIDWRDGRGNATLAASGVSTVPFDVSARAAFDGDRLEVNAQGHVDGRDVSLKPAAVATRQADGWHLAPVTLVTPDGTATVSGVFGATKAIKADLNNAGLAQIGAFFPALTLTGRMSGTIEMVLPPGAPPRGTASLRVNGLSRAGLAASSTPIDLGINVGAGDYGISARAVIVRGGAVEGRAQAHVGPLPADGETLMARLLASPLTAELRYAGPAQAIWGLAGIEALDVRGPVTIAANAGGRLGDPTLAGTIAARGARVEQATLGAVVDQVDAQGRFTASRLEFTSFSGRVGKDGSVSGAGTIGLSAEESFPMDIRMQLKNAAVINRDDMQATGTGSVRIATDQFGGVVSGDLHLDRAAYHAGRTAAVEVPVLAVTEKNTRVLRRPPPTYVKPTRWLLNVAVKGDRRLTVDGLGLSSEWRADLKIAGAATAPELRGRAELLRGDYDFAGKRFTLTKGDVRFVGVYPPDPIIDIVAENTSSNFTAQLAITGTGQRPNIKFSSTPALPEDEVLSRVLFGDSVTNLSAPEALQLAAALNGLRGGGSGFNPVNMVRKGLGIDRLRILSADPTTGRKTSVAAGQYIGRSLYVEVATDAQGYTATNIELGLTRSLSILSQLATLGGSSVNLRWKRDY